MFVRPLPVRWLVEHAQAYPRPVNHTKIYSAGQTSFGSGTPQDGIERFWAQVHRKNHAMLGLFDKFEARQKNVPGGRSIEVTLKVPLAVPVAEEVH